MVTQADIARAVRGFQDAGVHVERIRIRLERNAVTVEVTPAAGWGEEEPSKRDKAREGRVIEL